MNVALQSGVESSIRIDGKERCPGKPGVNMVLLDLIEYKFSSGILHSDDVLADVLNQFKVMKDSEIIFMVTQGDCMLVSEGEFHIAYGFSP